MKIRIDLKIILFIILFIFTKQIKVYGILMLFAMLHEIGHMVTGFALGFKPEKIEIMPLGLSIKYAENVENNKKKTGKNHILIIKKILVTLNGPLTNLFFIILFSLLQISFLEYDREMIIYVNILIGTFNLIPIYPLDGGRLLKYILHIFYGEEKSINYIFKISYYTVSLLTAISSLTILIYKNLAIIFILFYLWYIVLAEKKYLKIKEKVLKNEQNDVLNEIKKNADME